MKTKNTQKKRTFITPYKFFNARLTYGNNWKISNNIQQHMVK